MNCVHTVYDVDFLLRRNWFLDINDANELLWSLPDAMFEQIWERRWIYPPRIRILLQCDRIPDELRSKLKWKVTDPDENGF